MRGSGEWMGLAVPPHQKGPRHKTPAVSRWPSPGDVSWSGASQCFKELRNLLETEKATGVPWHSAKASSSSLPHYLES